MSELQLESGTYLIKSKSTDGAFIGRHIREDRSLLPKRVLLIPKDFQDTEDLKWEIIKVDDGNYILKTRGSPAVNIKDLLFGVLLPEPPATKWKIEAQRHLGQNTYTIIEAESGKGWVSPPEANEQVIIRHLIVLPTDPPKYPLDELFEITKI